MLTSKRIGNAIAERFGIEGIGVHCAAGMCSFFSDTNEEAMSVLMTAQSCGVYVARINHLSLDQWLESFYEIWQGAAPKRLKIQKEVERGQAK